MDSNSPYPKERLISLDLFRGLTMMLLAAEAAHVYHSIGELGGEGSLPSVLMTQFHHHPWNGLRFWDLIQPFFMFIVGVAMPLSLRSRLKRGDSWNDAFRHILKRCGLLFLFGTGLYAIGAGELTLELWNVLTQLSFTILVAFLLMRYSIRTQLIASAVLLVLTELLYRGYSSAEPYVAAQNFGSWLDMVLMGKLSRGHWVAVNCLPTAAHTIWGAVCGSLLLSDSVDNRDKIKQFLIAGGIGLLLGFGLDLAGITPIVKRIATTSFTLASGGWAVLALTLCYWWIDIKGHKDWTRVFLIMGTNSIFIYLFFELLGGWLRNSTNIFVHGFLSMVGMPETITALINSFLALWIMWYMCLVLFRKGIFLRV
ncbi:MAG: DUF5009 domain-containing protein [Bacteroidota bacterium]